MRTLPHWVLTDKFPAFYDSESATAIQQTAKVYAAMQELIAEYNSFVDEINNQLESFENETNAKNECFRECITKTLNDYIVSIDMKKDELESYMKTNLEETAEKLLNEIISDLNATIEQFKADRELLLAGFEEQNRAIDQQNNVLSSAINRMDTTLGAQNARIEEIATYMMDNLDKSINLAVAKLIADGEIVMGLAYNEDTDALTFNARNVTYDTDLAVGYDAATESVRIYENEGETIEEAKKTYFVRDGLEVMDLSCSTQSSIQRYLEGTTSATTTNSSDWALQSDNKMHFILAEGKRAHVKTPANVYFDTMMKACILCDIKLPSEDSAVSFFIASKVTNLTTSTEDIVSNEVVYQGTTELSNVLIEFDLTSITGANYLVIDMGVANNEDTSLKADICVHDIWIE